MYVNCFAHNFLCSVSHPHKWERYICLTTPMPMRCILFIEHRRNTSHRINRSRVARSTKRCVILDIPFSEVILGEDFSKSLARTCRRRSLAPLSPIKNPPYTPKMSLYPWHVRTITLSVRYDTQRSGRVSSHFSGSRSEVLKTHPPCSIDLFTIGKEPPNENSFLQRATGSRTSWKVGSRIR